MLSISNLHSKRWWPFRIFKSYANVGGFENGQMLGPTWTLWRWLCR